jgi:hypothetical protein
MIVRRSGNRGGPARWFVAVTCFVAGA